MSIYVQNVQEVHFMQRVKMEMKELVSFYWTRALMSIYVQNVQEFHFMQRVKMEIKALFSFYWTMALMLSLIHI